MRVDKSQKYIESFFTLAYTIFSRPELFRNYEWMDKI